MRFCIKNLTTLIACFAAGPVMACPFCDAPAQTLSEEIQSADAVVLAKLLKEAEPLKDGAPAGSVDPNAGMAKFQVVETLRGKEVLKDAKEIDVVYFGDSNRDRLFMVTGIGTEKIDWTTPLPLSPAAKEYVRQLPTVAPTGTERLAFFQEYLEQEDPLLAQDAYDEFARAPYDDLHKLGPQMKHDRLVKWVADPEISPSRRRLYLTMLGVCGSKDDLPLLESMIVSDFEQIRPFMEPLVNVGVAMGGPVGLPVWIEAVQQDERRKKLGLDALVACYLILRGPDGLDLIDERFLKNPKAEYTHVYSTIMALRFHGDQNTGVVPKERLLASMRLLLDNPDFADQVILDLSRWDDWSILDRLVTQYKSLLGDMKTNPMEKGYIRQPVVTYLTVASDQPGDVGTRAKAALQELETLDPETVKQARSLMAFGVLGRARSEAASNAAASNAAAPAASAVDGASSSDPNQGFGATAQDSQADASKIPDPANFGEGEKADASASAPPAPQPTAVLKPANDAAASKPAASTARLKPFPDPPLAHVSPVLVAGVPLVAAVLLMGVYWLILRAGAV